MRAIAIVQKKNRAATPIAHPACLGFEELKKCSATFTGRRATAQGRMVN
jgi:hypothetical protein